MMEGNKMVDEGRYKSYLKPNFLAGYLGYFEPPKSQRIFGGSKIF